MAIHSSVLAWRIPWTEKPGGLQFMGSQRVGHDWATNTRLKWITNKDLLYSTGNSAQRYVAAWMGGEVGGECIWANVWLSPFAIHLKLYNTVNWLYINIKWKIKKYIYTKLQLWEAPYSELRFSEVATYRMVCLSSMDKGEVLAGALEKKVEINSRREEHLCSSPQSQNSNYPRVLKFPL